MRRTAILLLILGVTVALTAAPATAKVGHGERTTATASITGPGLPVPITLSWRGQCGLPYPCGDLSELQNDLVILGMQTGVTGQTPAYAYGYYPVPAMGGRGPAYRLTYTVAGGDDERTVVQTLYPYAEGRPWVYTPAGQRLFERVLRPGWLPGPPSLVTMLQRLGLPSRPPATVLASAGGTGSPWAWIGLAAALLAGLVAGGAMAPRRAR